MKYIGVLISVLFVSLQAKSQEFTSGIFTNDILSNKSTTHGAAPKKTRAALPFIDDFSYDGPYPDEALWIDKGAYVNNTMTNAPVSRGVATLDGLNQYGRPYYPYSYSTGYGDSLTSQYLDLSTYTAADNIYLSFFYQPQGLGFAPETNDSLLLYFKNATGNWNKVWEARGTSLVPMKSAILPITSLQYLHDSFQFRFVNIVSMNTNDDTWHLDYIKIDQNRNPSDTLIKDVTMLQEPGSILSTYTAMPYRHFQANAAAELSTSQLVQLGNAQLSPQTYHFKQKAKELLSNTPLTTYSQPPAVIGAYGLATVNTPSYPITYTAPSTYSKVIVENTYYIDPVSPTDRRNNDTIRRNTVFDNYFSYDDGSAEKSYFLLSATNFPAKTALEFTLNIADTLRGLMVHFGGQAPTALGKYFSVVLYKHLGGLTSADTIIQQQDLYQVQYEPAKNGFSTYAFTNPVSLPAGKYYIGITQPANFGSDSIYYGLDVNTNSNPTKLYYNVNGSWLGSLTQGSIMLRPIVGQAFTATHAPGTTHKPSSTNFYPNPCSNFLYIESNENIKQCNIYSIDGKLLLSSSPTNNRIDISSLKAGSYLLICKSDSNQYITHKIQKN